MFHGLFYKSLLFCYEISLIFPCVVLFKKRIICFLLNWRYMDLIKWLLACSLYYLCGNINVLILMDFIVMTVFSYWFALLLFKNILISLTDAFLNL